MITSRVHFACSSSKKSSRCIHRDVRVRLSDVESLEGTRDESCSAAASELPVWEPYKTSTSSSDDEDVIVNLVLDMSLEKH